MARRARRKSGEARGPVAGIGADIVEIARIARSLARTRRFAETVFSRGEREYCEGCARPAEHYAARFAAKEAFLKAVGQGILEGIPLAQIEVVRGEGGEPALQLGPAAARAMKRRGGSRAMVTLSHAGGNAVAFVVIQ